MPLNYYDGIIIAVSHKIFIEMGKIEILNLCKKNHVIYDLKYLFAYTVPISVYITIDTLTQAMAEKKLIGCAKKLAHNWSCCNLVEYLLKYGAKKVRVLDDLSNGYIENIQEFMNHPSFEFIEGDIRILDTCKEALIDIDYVSHQAALGSVPRSIDNPLLSNAVNVSGFLNMLVAQKENNTVKRLVYAASSSTYGDHKALPKVEDNIGKPLSPYAVTKYVNELYADVFKKAYDFNSIGLRYFNVFGKRQTPKSTYAAVIPKWIDMIASNQEVFINGDGETSRDFCFIENAVQANILAATTTNQLALNNIYNIAVGDRTSLNQLYKILREFVKKESKLQHSKVNHIEALEMGM